MLHRRWTLKLNMSQSSTLYLYHVYDMIYLLTASGLTPDLRPSPGKTFNKIDMSGTNKKFWASINTTPACHSVSLIAPPTTAAIGRRRSVCWVSMT